MEASKRIDKGIKRGPRSRVSVPRRRDPETGVVQGIPPGLNPKEVLDKYLTEQTTSQIAKHYGVSRKTLVGWLREVAADDWKRVQIVRALCRKEDGDEQIEFASDALSLARAREMLKSGQWDLERLDSPTYGQKSEVSLTVEPLSDVDRALLGDASALLQVFREKIIEAEPLPSLPVDKSEKQD